MTTGMLQEQNLEKHIEKQMGCMAGFLQIFDRHQILAGKRLYSAKRLPPSVTVDSTPESEKTIGSPAVSRELEKSHNTRSTPSPDRLKQPPVATELRSPVPENHHHHHPPPPSDAPPKPPLPLPVFEFKEGTRSAWKFSREAPRLSLDSRAIVDAKGSLYPREIKTNAAILSANRTENPNAGDEDEGDKSRRSPSVIARLMGLEPLQSSDPEPFKKAELRRSASESRVSKDLYQHRFVDGNTFQAKQSQQAHFSVSSNVVGENGGNEDRSFRTGYPKAYAKPHELPKAHKGMVMGLRKSYFDTADCYPEPKQTASSVYGEIERRLKMRGIDEPSKDLETLKQILEALQLKGLLHSKKPSTQIDYRNFVYDRSFSNDESPIVVMKPARSPSPTSRSSWVVGNESPPLSSFRSRPGSRRNVGYSGENVVSPRRDRRVEVDQYSRNRSPGRNQAPPSRNESCVKSPNRRRPLSIETQRKGSDVMERRRVSPVQSPKLNPRRTGSDQQSQNRSPRNRRPTVEIHRKEDESSTMSESSIITSTDTERTKMEEYKEGRSLLERCDKLLHSIAEITTSTTTAELQPSPVSVLDSSFYKDESSTSPIMKRSIGFKAEPVELEEEIWGSAAISLPPFESNFSGEEAADCDLVYISDILRASNYLPEDSDVFLLLEKKQYRNGNDTSKVSRLQRRLIFDTINEILHRNRRLPPWKVVVSSANSTAEQVSLREIWLEFRKIRERDESEDLFEVICGVLRKDLAGDAAHGWGDCPVEVSEAVLDIERLIFKDLIGETIRDLAGFSANCYKPSPLCRKLVF